MAVAAGARHLPLKNLPWGINKACPRLLASIACPNLCLLWPLPGRPLCAPACRFPCSTPPPSRWEAGTTGPTPRQAGTEMRAGGLQCRLRSGRLSLSSRHEQVLQVQGCGKRAACTIQIITPGSDLNLTANHLWSTGHRSLQSTRWCSVSRWQIRVSAPVLAAVWRDRENALGDSACSRSSRSSSNGPSPARCSLQENPLGVFRLGARALVAFLCIFDTKTLIVPALQPRLACLPLATPPRCCRAPTPPSPTRLRASWRPGGCSGVGMCGWVGGAGGGGGGPNNN